MNKSAELDRFIKRLGDLKLINRVSHEDHEELLLIDSRLNGIEIKFYPSVPAVASSDTTTYCDE